MSYIVSVRVTRLVATTLAIATMVFGGAAAPALAATASPSKQATAALSDPPAPTNPTIARANQIMGLDYKAFDALPKNEAPFDWGNDGCSNPAGSVPVLGDFDDDFFRACVLHDFGYRNYGHGLALSPNEDTRGWIDDRLLQETRRICNNEVPFLDRLICHGVASAFWTAVRTFGRGSFYNG